MNRVYFDNRTYVRDEALSFAWDRALSHLRPVDSALWSMGPWTPPVTAVAPAPTPATDVPPPRYFDLRLHEYKHWKDKLKVMYNGVDVSAMTVAAHAGESWVVLFTKDTKNLDTDPLEAKRGKVTVDKK